MAQNPFSLDKERYDSSTYLGRVKNAYEVSDIRTIFASQKDIYTALRLLDDYKTGALASVPEEELWRAKKIKAATTHPDTGETIVLPFRMSFYVPANIFIVAGMVQARSIPATVFWQFANQTYNVCLNHANRNASNEMSQSQLVTAYLGAVGSSVGTAVGLNEWVKRAAISPALRNNLLMLVPFTAVAVANVFNISMMRWNEMTQGIDVKDEEGNSYGKSQAAGKRGIIQTIISRVLMVVPGMVFPPVIMAQMEKTRFMQQRKWLMTPMNMALVGGFIYGAIPLCLGMVPQNSKVDVNKLEEKFRNLRDKRGEAITQLYYNKGL